MKKKLYLLFGFLMSLLLIGVVKAEGPFYFDWNTDKEYDLYAEYNTRYQDGYITIDGSYDGSVITIYDFKGNILADKEYLDRYIINVLVDGDKIYTVEEQWANGEKYYVREYNNKLVVQHEIQVPNPAYYYFVYGFPAEILNKIDGDLYYIVIDSIPGGLKLEDDLSDYEEIYEKRINR